MWHFGADASIRYSGEKFYASWEVAKHGLIAIYSKRWKGGRMRIRKELQEYPNKPISVSLEEKLNAVNSTGGGIV